MKKVEQVRESYRPARVRVLSGGQFKNRRFEAMIFSAPEPGNRGIYIPRKYKKWGYPPLVRVQGRSLNRDPFDALGRSMEMGESA